MRNMQEKAWESVLAAISARIADNPRGELSAIASEIGVTRGTVSRWLSGGLKGQRIPYDRMAGIMRALGLDPAACFPAIPAGVLSGGQQEETHAPPEIYFQVPWLEARASMGGGSLEVSRKIRSHLSFRRDWLLAKGNADNMVVISVEGDSMSPTIPDGSVVLINEGSASPPVNGKIYLVCYLDELFLKRLKVRDHQVLALISDFDSSEIFIKKGEYFAILGRAIWYGKDL
ncbi:MAG: S24 family peptidase [Deltaproteobacteria bacterium]|jgi:transcriptional regulator with XRE-family HTH domain|nr:S24 family peptidase [Deltaproteobacteria bacterium]